MICVLGSTGLLGSAVSKYMIEKYGEDNVVLSWRNPDLHYGKYNFYFDACGEQLYNIPKCDYVINCIGTIIPFMQDNYKESIYTNSIFPVELARHCLETNTKLISITTDCVYDGKSGNYTEDSKPCPKDAYGMSKALGDMCKDYCMLLRTSIIGEEMHKNASLIEWAKSQKNNTINGFTNHMWNGVTTKQYAKICSQIIDRDLYEIGLFNVFSDVVSKYALLDIIDTKFNLNLTINEHETPVKCDRTLSTVKSLMQKLDIPDIRTQISEL